MPDQKTSTISVNPAAKAVLPNGSTVDRSAVLQQLGLNPATPPDAWLAIFGCGSNASALHPGDLNSLVSKGTINREQLDPHSLNTLRSGGGD